MESNQNTSVKNTGNKQENNATGKWNPGQQRAICYGDGPLLVLAGPGSGKTTVIAHRVQQMVNVRGIAPTSILVITFTRAAAEEMRERFALLCRKSVPPVTFSTFHSFFFRILKYAYGYTAESIVREEEQRQIIREALEKETLDIGDESEFIQNVLSEIGLLKNDRIPSEQWMPRVCERPVFLRLYRSYEQRMRQMRKIDFDDMLVYTYELLSQRKDILAAWQNRFRYFLVDEFQDVNRIQYDILRLLAGERQNLFVVGDDDPSIYRFRGARPEIMLHFQEDFPKADRVLLDVNYRSQAEIVTRSLCLIAHNEERYRKALRAHRKPGRPVDVREFRNVPEETAFLVEDIRKRLENGTPPGSMAVLYRTANQARPLLDRMMEFNVPFSVRDGMPDIYHHWIALDMMSYIRIGMGGRERKDFLRVMNRPNRYISREAVNSVQLSFENLEEYYREKDWMQERIDRFWYDAKMIGKMNPYGALHYIRHVVGYEAYLLEYAAQRGIPASELTDVLEELMEAAKNYDSFDAWFSHIAEYQQEWQRQMQKKRADREAVAFMTMHASKGLEYPIVYIVDANEEITPHKKAVTTQEIEEERRLFYVAMTRAKNELHICSVKERYGRRQEPSRFIGELLFDREKAKEKGTVWHKVYGTGKLLSIKGDKAEILFDRDHRRITLNMAYCIEKGILRTEQEKGR